ncbi:ParB N-terminal domain-containing protein [Methylomusa anaerophila]|uniref:Uncharacterized protein n=1 Tax=Methylomusa anaerophila TaxID=1930071 RepID=A0A348AMH2_9FIRM|nr:hypothetical protein [Methylomusa anaerophila]BBB92270.1 hypothetical protein MAMMFC1_02955 [Methylomusa anaerophila]
MENMEMGNSTIANEMDMRQSVATSHESGLQEITESTTGNEFASSKNLASKFSAVFETMDNFEAHSFAEIFPDATKEEYESLLEDVRVHGQYEPVIIFEDKIADGRTRQKAQQELKRSLLAQTWLGSSEELLNYLYAKSQHRNLNSQQRAVVALQFVQVERELAQKRKGMRTDLNRIVDAVRGRALDQVAKKGGTNRTYIAYAEKIDKEANELLDYVKRNEIPITQAKLLAEKLKISQDRLAAVSEYKKGGRTMSAIIDEISYKNGTGCETSSDETQNQGFEVDKIPALFLFQSLQSWQDQEAAKTKIKQVAEILGINSKEVWYIPDNNDKDAKAVLKLMQSFVKRLKMIRRFSAEGQELKHIC